MYFAIPLLPLLTLASALPHDDPSDDHRIVTETIFVTVTHTLGETSLSSSLAAIMSPSTSSLATTTTSACTHFSDTHTDIVMKGVWSRGR